MRLIYHLLRKNTSTSRIVGFALSNFIGLLIVAGAVMFYVDSRAIFADDDSVVNSDFLVLNKEVTSAGIFGDKESTRFSADEIADLRAQPWVRGVGEFSSSDFRVYASVNTGGRGMETALFFESVPDTFVDVSKDDWQYSEGDESVPVIISKDYLALYNFGFAGSAGLPQLSEQLISGIPLNLYLRSDDGSRTMSLKGHIAGFSNRLNTLLVPESFMKYANSQLGSDSPKSPSRLIVDVSSPGDVDIDKYLDDHSLEVAGDNTKSQAAYLLKVVIGLVITVGAIITLLSLLVLMLSISLLMEKNKSTIHRLLMLGTPLKTVGAPYRRMIIAACVGAWILSMVALLLLRSLYLPAIEAFGGSALGIFYALGVGILLAAAIVIINICGVNRKVKASW